jgi:hypothetical protein
MRSGAKASTGFRYIVTNKVELRNVDDIEAILNSFETCLDDTDLNYAGI